MKVLIVESDLGFVFWLGQALDKAGYASMPAKNVSDAFSVISDFDLTVGLLIVNPRLPGAAVLADLVHRSAPGAWVIGLTDNPTTLAAFPWVDSYQSKPKTRTEIAKLEWLQIIQAHEMVKTLVPWR